MSSLCCVFILALQIVILLVLPTARSKPVANQVDLRKGYCLQLEAEDRCEYCADYCNITRRGIKWEKFGYFLKADSIEEDTDPDSGSDIVEDKVTVLVTSSAYYLRRGIRGEKFGYSLKTDSIEEDTDPDSGSDIVEDKALDSLEQDKTSNSVKEDTTSGEPKLDLQQRQKAHILDSAVLEKEAETIACRSSDCKNYREDHCLLIGKPYKVVCIVPLQINVQDLEVVTNITVHRATCVPENLPRSTESLCRSSAEENPLQECPPENHSPGNNSAAEHTLLNKDQLEPNSKRPASNQEETELPEEEKANNRKNSEDNREEPRKSDPETLLEIKANKSVLCLSKGTTKGYHCEPLTTEPLKMTDKKSFETNRPLFNDTYNNERHNFYRLTTLLIDAGTQVLREVFRSYVLKQETSVGQFLSANKKIGKTKHLLSQGQKDLLFPTSGPPDVEKFDISLLCYLLKNVSYNQEQKMEKLRHARDELVGYIPSSDVPGVDMDRLKEIRNVFGHKSEYAVEKTDFSRLWTTISEAMIDLSKDVDGNFRERLKTDMDNLQKQSEVESTKVHDAVIQWYLNDLSHMEKEPPASVKIISLRKDKGQKREMDESTKRETELPSKEELHEDKHDKLKKRHTFDVYRQSSLISLSPVHKILTFPIDKAYTLTKQEETDRAGRSSSEDHQVKAHEGESLETENFYRLMELTLNIGSDAVRHLLLQRLCRLKMDPTMFWKTKNGIIKRLQKQGIFSREDASLLHFQPDVKKMDMLLMINCLLWIMSKDLSKEERNALERMRLARNSILHAPKTTMTDAEFKTEFEAISLSIQSLADCCGDAELKEEICQKIEAFSTAEMSAKQDKERTNLCKLLSLLINDAADALRRILLRDSGGNVTALLLPHKNLFLKLEKRKIIRRQEILKLYPEDDKEVDIDDLDTSLLCTVLVNISSLMTKCEEDLVKELRKQRGAILRLCGACIKEEDCALQLDFLKRILEKLKLYDIKLSTSVTVSNSDELEDTQTEDEDDCSEEPGGLHGQDIIVTSSTVPLHTCEPMVKELPHPALLAGDSCSSLCSLESCRYVKVKEVSLAPTVRFHGLDECRLCDGGSKFEPEGNQYRLKLCDPAAVVEAETLKPINKKINTTREYSANFTTLIRDIVADLIGVRHIGGTSKRYPRLESFHLVTTPIGSMGTRVVTLSEQDTGTRNKESTSDDSMKPGLVDGDDLRCIVTVFFAGCQFLCDGNKDVVHCQDKLTRWMKILGRLQLMEEGARAIVFFLLQLHIEPAEVKIHVTGKCICSLLKDIHATCMQVPNENRLLTVPPNLENLATSIQACSRKFPAIQNTKNDDISVETECFTNGNTKAKILDEEDAVNETLNEASDDEEDELEFDQYFQRKFRCGSAVPLNDESIQSQSQLPRQHSKFLEQNEEKKHTLDLLYRAAAQHTSEAVHGTTPKRDFMAVTVPFPQVSQQRNDDGDDKDIQIANKVSVNEMRRVLKRSQGRLTLTGLEYEPGEKELRLMLRDTTWLPIDQLPVPQVDREIIVGYVQHDSLDDIFRMMTLQNPPGPQTTMKYEILRVCTYRNFPQDNKPYSIRLAGAGFYFAAEGDELTCYCCGLRKRGWTAEDIPVVLHERASPTCPYFTKNLDVNVPVPHPPDAEPHRLAILDASQETAAPTLGAAAASAMAVPTPEKNSLISESARHVAEAQKRALTTNADNRRRPGNMAYQTTNHPLQQNSGNQSAIPSQNEAAIQQRGLGIDLDKPKHPQYAVKQVRRQSYENWPQNVHQRPDDLVEAGFYYAGFGDCVRCFFCGIGLRHWSEEDNPWIEHARWSASCVYLRQVKGDEFVDLVQLAVQYSNEEDEDIPGGETGAAESGEALRQQTPKEDTQNYLLTDAAQSVLEMGYQPRMVQKAIDAVLKQKGREGITATNIMEKVLELEETAAAMSLQRDLASMNLSGTSDSQQKSSEQGKEDKKDKDNDSQGSDTKVDTQKILKQNKELKEQTLCKICLDNPVCIVFLPCGHLVTCAECAPAMRKCPICRALVKGTVKTYMA